MKKIVSCILITAMIFLMTACGMKEKMLVGTWKHHDTVLGVVTETTYVFNEDGTGTKSGLLSVEFTYVVEEDTLSMTYNTLGLETTEEYTFEFKSGDLVLTDDDTTIKLESVK